MGNIIIDGNTPSQIIPEQGSINDTVPTNYTTYSSEKIEALDEMKMDKEVDGATGEILIKDASGNAQASGFKTDDFALSSHNHDASEMVLSTVNFGGVLDETIDTAQKLADWIDDTGLHQAEITAEIAQDAVGNILTDTDSINFSYNDTLGQITADVKPDATQTFTNKTITDYSNTVYAEALTFHVKATQTINKGQPVRITGYNSGENAFEVVLANQATGVANGVALQNLTTGQFGLMLSDGIIEGINTSSFTEGTILYLDGTGAFQSTVPATGYIQQLAYVLRSHAVNGALQIKAQSPLQRVSDISGLQTTLDGKANLAGGNTFSGNQDVAGRISSTAGIVWGNSDNKGVINLNTLLIGGEYATEPGSTNIPVGADAYGYVTVRNYGSVSGYTQQEYSNLAGGVTAKKWIRKMDAGVWGDWTQVADGSAWTSYTPVVGDGTNTATITINSAYIHYEGRRLHFNFDLSINNKGSCSGIFRTYLPVTVLGTNACGGNYKGGANNGTFSSYANFIVFCDNATSWAEMQWSSVTNGDRYIVSGTLPY